MEEAKSFAEAARHIGHADPDDVTEHLRRATKAFLAGDHGSARAVFEAILPPIASVDIDLGQHELVEEVLGVDARACVAQYVASVYTTTPLRNRADAILRALEQVEGVGTLSSPIKDMEGVSAGALPDLGAFLPLWVKRLQRFRPSKDGWEKRVEGILGNSRRQHYSHAALLVASCVAFAPKKRAAELLRWAMDLRQQYWRRHAFREELARACESLGVLVSA